MEHNLSGALSLPVRDPRASTRFYGEVFGLACSRAGEGWSLVVSPLHGYEHVAFRFDLAERPDAAVVSMEVETTGELLDLYLLARLLGAEATPIVFQRGLPTISIIDPDGHRLNIQARPLAEPGYDAHVRRMRSEPAVRFAREDRGRTPGARSSGVRRRAPQYA